MSGIHKDSMSTVPKPEVIESDKTLFCLVLSKSKIKITLTYMVLVLIFIFDLLVHYGIMIVILDRFLFPALGKVNIHIHSWITGSFLL